MRSDPRLEGCGLTAKCESRGQRTQLQWRLGRLYPRFVSGFFVAGVADPGRSAERLTERFFWKGRRPDSNQCVRIRVSKDVARRPSIKAGASVPSYSRGLAAYTVVSYRDHCSRGSLTPVAAPNVFLAGNLLRINAFVSAP
jgi:hypothetical protein